MRSRQARITLHFNAFFMSFLYCNLKVFFRSLQSKSQPFRMPRFSYHFRFSDQPNHYNRISILSPSRCIIGVHRQRDFQQELLSVFLIHFILSIFSREKFLLFFFTFLISGKEPRANRANTVDTRAAITVRRRSSVGG